MSESLRFSATAHSDSALASQNILHLPLLCTGGRGRGREEGKGKVGEDTLVTKVQTLESAWIG